jgi:tripartite-type tricarboxylate transporter receptor subunit TctC
MPRELVQRVQRELAATINGPEVSKFVATQGFDIVGSTPEVFADRVKNEFARFGKVLNEAGIKPE